MLGFSSFHCIACYVVKQNTARLFLLNSLNYWFDNHLKNINRLSQDMQLKIECEKAVRSNLKLTCIPKQSFTTNDDFRMLGRLSPLKQGCQILLFPLTWNLLRLF